LNLKTNVKIWNYIVYRNVSWYDIFYHEWKVIWKNYTLKNVLLNIKRLNSWVDFETLKNNSWEQKKTSN
jgi:hypothetical protein